MSVSGERKEEPPAAKGLAPFGMASVLAAGPPAFGCKPTISLWRMAKPMTSCDHTKSAGCLMSITCGASKEVDIN